MNEEKEYILEKYNWAEQYKCEKCNAKFYSCKWCNKDNMKENLFYRSRLSRHNKKHSKDDTTVIHRTKRSKLNLEVVPIVNEIDTTHALICPMIDDIKSNIEGCDDLKDEGTNVIGNHRLVEDMFDRKETYNYINHNISVERPYDGPSYLVGRAISDTSNLHEKMDENDIMLHLLMAKFVNKLSKKQRLEFAFILKLLSKKFKDKSKCETSKSNGDDNNEATFETIIPTTDSALRNIYMVGSSSILKNLPRPKVGIVDEHSYVSIRQCIAQFFASGKMPQECSKTELKKIMSISDSNVRKEVYARAVKANHNISADNLI